MVRIVIGKINSFKTTKMIDLYETEKRGDGFVSVKRMLGDKVHSYDALRLSSKAENLFIIRDEFNETNEEIACQIGPYQMLKDTLDSVEQAITGMIEKNIEPIYLDEIGLLELEGSGFSEILRKMIASGLDLVISVRTDLLQKIVKKYKIKEYAIIE